ncbi:Reverse transcriptase [Phytophthora palmivora]|uniref:Reverse transcriptase n=1 Tax=Phytophthora palmivora TaxID=4796 RepID=A0A2P4XP57_9STRA|nr:Reverse transcriptase [Phytophthora palmivora]
MLNVLADALSRQPDYELAHVTCQVDQNYTLLVQFVSDGKAAKVERLSPRQLHHYELAEDPSDPPRVAVPNNDGLKYDILLLETHGSPMSGHLSREKTYQAVAQAVDAPACTCGLHTLSSHVKHVRG